MVSQDASGNGSAQGLAKPLDYNGSGTAIVRRRKTDGFGKRPRLYRNRAFCLQVTTYFFELLDEDQKDVSSGIFFERHWGLFTETVSG